MFDAQQAKPWWQSRAVLGALATIIVGIAGLFHVQVDSATLTEFLLGLTTTITGALALWGSIQRKAPIDPTLVAPGVRRDGVRLRRVPSDRKRRARRPEWPDPDLDFNEPDLEFNEPDLDRPDLDRQERERAERFGREIDDAREQSAGRFWGGRGGGPFLDD
jgi:hypothetical protein